VVDPVTCERATFDIEAHDKHGAHNPSAFQRILAAPQLIECVSLLPASCSDVLFVVVIVVATAH